jgi:hypothetical protein
MPDKRKNKNARLLELVVTFRIPRVEIARRFECSAQYISLVIHGHRKCPPRLKSLIFGMAHEYQQQSLEILRPKKAI